MVVTTPTMFAATREATSSTAPRVRSPLSRLSLHPLFRRLRSANSSSGIRPDDGVGTLSWAISRALTRARVGAALGCPAEGIQSMRVQAASTERAFTCHDASLSDVRRAEAVSTTAVVNAGENSTLGADAFHATLPLKKAASPRRCRWDATSRGRVEGEGEAVVPAAADATD